MNKHCWGQATATSGAGLTPLVRPPRLWPWLRTASGQHLGVTCKLLSCDRTTSTYTPGSRWWPPWVIPPPLKRPLIKASALKTPDHRVMEASPCLAACPSHRPEDLLAFSPPNTVPVATTHSRGPGTAMLSPPSDEIRGHGASQGSRPGGTGRGGYQKPDETTGQGRDKPDPPGTQVRVRMAPGAGCQQFLPPLPHCHPATQHDTQCPHPDGTRWPALKEVAEPYLPLTPHCPACHGLNEDLAGPDRFRMARRCPRPTDFHLLPTGFSP